MGERTCWLAALRARSVQQDAATEVKHPVSVPLPGVFDMVVSVNEDLREQNGAAYDAVASDYATIIPDTSFEAPPDPRLSVLGSTRLPYERV
jgi:hypothetical protein